MFFDIAYLPLFYNQIFIFFYRSTKIKILFLQTTVYYYCKNGNGRCKLLHKLFKQCKTIKTYDYILDIWLRFVERMFARWALCRSAECFQNATSAN